MFTLREFPLGWSHEERHHDLFVPLPAREDQRRGPLVRPGVEVRAEIDEQLRHFEVALSARNVERGGSPAQIRANVTSGTIPNQGSRSQIIQQTCRGSFSPVSKPILQVNTNTHLKALAEI